MMNQMDNNARSDIDPMAQIQKAAELYSEYLEIASISDVVGLNDNRWMSYSAPKPAPMVLTFDQR